MAEMIPSSGALANTQETDNAADVTNVRSIGSKSDREVDDELERKKKELVNALTESFTKATLEDRYTGMSWAVRNTCFEKAIPKFLSKCELELSPRGQDRIAGILQTITKGQQVDADTWGRALDGASHVDESPLRRFLATARNIMSCPVFMNDGSYSSVASRCIGGHFIYSIIPTALYTTLVEKLSDGPTLTAPTLIVSGHAGSGKTMALLGLGGLPDTILVYGVSSALGDTNVGQNSNEKSAPASSAIMKVMVNEKHKSGRDASMISLIARHVKASIPDMSTLRELGADIKLIIAFDEMGPYPGAVRAMCSLDKAALRRELELDEKVEIRLVAAGTGIGEGDKPPGSCKETFEEIRAQNRDDMNLQVFDMYYLRRTKKAEGAEVAANKSLITDEYVKEVIEGNCRMAAILGVLVRSAVTKIRNESDEERFKHLDLSQFLTPAAFEFKALGGLDTLPLTQVNTRLMQAIRFHCFPNAYPDAGLLNSLVTQAGLMIDLIRWTKDPCSEEHLLLDTIEITEGNSVVTFRQIIPKYSRFNLPPSSVILLTLLSGREAVARSVASGSSLERYCLSLFHTLACAACNVELLLLYLQSPNLAPLNNYYKKDVRLPAAPADCKHYPDNDNIVLTKPREVSSTFIDLSGVKLIQDVGSDAFYAESNTTTNALDEEDSINEILRKLERLLRSRLREAFSDARFARSDDERLVAALKYLLANGSSGSLEDKVLAELVDTPSSEDEKVRLRAGLSAASEFIAGAVMTAEKCDTEKLDVLIRDVLRVEIDVPQMEARMKKIVEGKCRVVAFASPDQMCFANSGLFMDDTLILCQAKDYHPSYYMKIDIHYERWKMGATDDQAIAAFKKTEASQQQQSQHNYLVSLIALWREATGMQINKVQLVFVTPSPIHDAKGGSKHTIEIETGLELTFLPDVFVSVDQVKFMKFSTNRVEDA